MRQRRSIIFGLCIIVVDISKPHIISPSLDSRLTSLSKQIDRLTFFLFPRSSDTSKCLPQACTIANIMAARQSQACEHCNLSHAYHPVTKRAQDTCSQSFTTSFVATAGNLRVPFSSPSVSPIASGDLQTVSPCISCISPRPCYETDSLCCRVPAL